MAGAAFVSATLVPPASAQTMPVPDAALARVAWLAGCWQPDGEEAGSEERWLPPAGGTMLGMSRTVARGRTVFFEFMQLRVDGEGRLVFVGHPSGKAGTRFTQMPETDVATTSFENPRTEFPQRIHYRQAAPDKLQAWIDGTKDGRPARVDFSMTRIACDRPAPAR